MAFIQMSFYSEILGVMTDIGAVIPQHAPGLQKCGGQLPLLYLLHGLGNDQTEWTRHSGIERYAEEKGLALVLPRVDRSYYTDMKQGGAYLTYVGEEIPALVQKLFPVSGRRENTFVAGISMGGYGAFKLALRYPERYAAAASLSGGLDIVSRLLEPNNFRPEEAERIFGSVEELRGSGDDLFALARRAAAEGSQPLLYQCCGTEDFLLEANRAFAGHAAEIGLKITYEEAPGEHEWGYWDRQARRMLEWLPL